MRLPYSEPSGLFDYAAESVWDVRTWNNIVNYSNEDDSYFVLRGALFASKNFTYRFESSGKSYPAAIVKETNLSASPEILGEHINNNELE